MYRDDEPYGIVIGFCLEFDTAKDEFQVILHLTGKPIDTEKVFAFLDIKLKKLPEHDREELCNNLGIFFKHLDASLSEKYFRFAKSKKDLNAFIEDLPKDNCNNVSENLRREQESFFSRVEYYVFAKFDFDDCMKNDHAITMKSVLDKVKIDLDFANETIKCFKREGYEREAKQIEEIIENY